MEKQHIKGGRTSDMSRNSLSALPDYNNCLVNLSNSILKKFGAPTTAGTLPLADKYLEGEYKNVVLLILDALGTSIVERHLEENGFFRSHMAGALDSVYPPTTVAATTSILSGLYPNEHGWLGWDVYYPQINKNVTVFLNTEQQKEKENAVPSAADPDGKKRWAEDSLEKAFPAAAYNVGFQYTPYKNIIEIINESSGSAYAAMPFMPPYPQSADAILHRVEKLCHEPGRKFIYAYWNEPDSTMHKTGTGSPETHRIVTMLEKMVEKTVSGLSDTLFLITADHGHIDSKNVCLLDYPEIMRCLVRPPSFEPRTLNLFVKDEYKETFPKIFNKYFGDSFVLLTKDEALSERLFGTGNDRDGLEDMIGDYIALAISDKSIFITHFHTQEMRGVHAGLTEAERKIPFIVIEKK